MTVQVSITDLAHAFSMARETVKRRLDDRKVKSTGGSRPKYELRDAVQAILHEDDPDRLDPFRRKASLQSEQIALRLAVERGELVPCDDVRETFAKAFKPIRLTLETLPDILERDAGLTPPQVARCERVLDEVREQLHDEVFKVTNARKRR